MENLNNLTVVIVTYLTQKKILLNCLNSISKEVKIKIIENSENFEFKKDILNKFSNVEIECTGKNLGYGNGNNFGLNLTQTDFALILNPVKIAEFAKKFKDGGATILGGCCETRPSHIQQLSYLK